MPKCDKCGQEISEEIKVIDGIKYIRKDTKPKLDDKKDNPVKRTFRGLGILYNKIASSNYVQDMKATHERQSKENNEVLETNKKNKTKVQPSGISSDAFDDLNNGLGNINF
jgi:hypothetical protein